MRRPYVRALQGVVLSAGSPLGWLALRTLAGVTPAAELAANPGVYAYMAVGTALAFGGFGAYIGRHEEQHLEDSLHDELTGLHNARYFRRRLAEETAFAARHGRPLAVLVGDIDLFKHVNDECGHAAGDQVLAAIGKQLLALRRRGDTVARVGGEEFGWLLPETELREAVGVAERLRGAVAQLRFDFGKGPPGVTLSVGAAVSPPGQPLGPDELYRAADGALYRAKRAGRNRVATAGMSAPGLATPASAT